LALSFISVFCPGWPELLELLEPLELLLLVPGWLEQDAKIKDKTAKIQIDFILASSSDNENIITNPLKSILTQPIILSMVKSI
jgi:hypothetical protein